MAKLIALAVAVALAATGCTEPAPVAPAAEYSYACADANMVRVDDALCPDWYLDDDDTDGFFAVFFLYGVHVPAVGHGVSTGSRARPVGTFTVYKAPARGGYDRVYLIPAKPVKPAKPAVPVQGNKPAAPPAPAKPANPGGGFRKFK